ncbi:MAG: dienelactone hydrolase family protein [Actinomycetota bacterium]
MGLFVAEPDSTPRGAVIVIQEAFGITPHIQSVCHFLADAGWLAVAPVLFHRVGSPVFSYDDIAGAMPAMQSLTREGIDADLDASVQHLQSRGFDAAHTGIVGFCMGGSVTLYAAATRTLGAAVTFYGGGLAQGRFGFAPGLELGADIKVPWLGLYGDQDQSIPFDDVERLRGIAAARHVPTHVVRYAEGLHGFNCDDRPSVFNADIAADARARLLAWFDEHLG